MSSKDKKEKIKEKSDKKTKKSSSKDKEKDKKKEKSVSPSDSEQKLEASKSKENLINQESYDKLKNGPVDPALVSFEAGQLFSRYDQDNDGKLSKHEFTQLVRLNPELLHGAYDFSKRSQFNSLPAELISNRILTHFDETAGVAIARSEVDHHRNMGNIVTTLAEAYKVRYERLRSMLTGKLLPKREHLLQLRRQLQNAAIEVDAKRKSIEKETLADTEQILERLRTVESMRQSGIRHQVLQLEEELQAIERIVKRVEQANIDDSLNQDGISSVLLTSASPGAIPMEAVRTPRALNMVELIHQFGELCSSIDRSSAKPITVQVDFPTDDFPKETAERLEVLARCDKYMHAVTVKDHMLWTAIKEKEKVEEKLAEETRLCEDYAKEVAHWAEMSQDLTRQLMGFKQELEKSESRNRDLMMLLRQNNIYPNFENEYN